MKERKRILLVEAETVLADVTAFRLELHGYDVSVVATAEEAIRQLGVARPDLILTDLVLPGMDGLALVEQLMIDPQTSEIPVIVLSIDADLDRVHTVYGLGARDFVVVPYHPEVLEEKVAKHLTAAQNKKNAETSLANAATNRGKTASGS